MFKYLLAFFISLGITLIAMPSLISYLHKIKFGQVEREEGLASHKVKSGTPTMGGIAFVIIPVLVLLLLDAKAFLQKEIIVVVLAYLGYAIIGFIDDFIIVVQKNNEGLKPSVKFLMQSILAVVFYFLYQGMASTSVYLPILNIDLELGFLYFGLVFIMFTAESNAVNLTDGLDGLCAGTTLIVLAPFVIFAIIQKFDDLALFLLAVEGALLGYLKYNIHPAKVFMGDTGSLALGGLLAGVAMVLKREILLVLIGSIFLIEVLSVMIQVISFKTRGKRVFKMAPIHHHFELCGFKETQVVILFWSFALICAAVGLVIGII